MAIHQFPSTTRSLLFGFYRQEGFATWFAIGMPLVCHWYGTGTPLAIRKWLWTAELARGSEGQPHGSWPGAAKGQPQGSQGGLVRSSQGQQGQPAANKSGQPQEAARGSQWPGAGSPAGRLGCLADLL